MARGRSCIPLALVLLAGTPALAQPDAGPATGPVVRLDGHKVVRVPIRNLRDFRTAMAFTDDLWTHTPRAGEPIDMVVSPAQLAGLATSGLSFTIILNDVQQAIDAETRAIQAHRAQDDPLWYTSYHNYDDNKAYCQALAAAHPTLCTYIVLGQSVQARDIFGLRITGPGSTANRNASIWWGGQHAREWLTVPIPEYCAEQLLARYATDAHIRHLVDNTEFIIVPIMNPDGYSYTWTNNRLWRKNRRNNTGSGFNCNNFGVDLNRNWGHQWGGEGASTSCNNDTYRGPSAFSEPETQVMRNFMLANTRIRTSMDWHSYGQLIMSPWGYTSALPTPAAVATDFQSCDNAMAAAAFAVHGRTYAAGPLYTTIYPASGVAVDWSWGGAGIKGFTIEVRASSTTGQPGGATGQISGFEAPPEDIVPNCEENFAAFLALADITAPPPAPPCYPNCDGSTTAPTLNVQDFSCFLNSFAAGETYANCDGSTTEPVLNVQDFACFLNSFAAGCS